MVILKGYLRQQSPKLSRSIKKRKKKESAGFLKNYKKSPVRNRISKNNKMALLHIFPFLIYFSTKFHDFLHSSRKISK